MPNPLSAIQDLATTAGAFFFVLGIVVFVHEFGHFQVARWCKVAIEAFSIGFGPRLAGWKDKQSVEWRIGVLPLGGFVKFVDDSDPTSTLAQEPPKDPVARAEARRRGLFHAQSVGVRAAVAAAGPAANFIFSIVAFGTLALIYGSDATDENALSPRIDSVQAGSPAEKAGIHSGDVIVSMAGTPVPSWGAVKDVVPAHVNQPMRVVVRRGGETVTLTATPMAVKTMDAQGVEHTSGILGIARNTLPSERTVQRYTPIGAIGVGAERVWEIVASTGGYIGNVFTGRASAEHIAGPIGILGMSGQVAKDAGEGPTLGVRIENLFHGLIAWAATLSVAVGIVNLLPIPILDGGHLLFYAIEGVRGRPLDQKAQLLGFKAGLALLGSLFLFATWNDLQRLNVLEFLSKMLS
jgi:regulator of sigma E protease